MRRTLALSAALAFGALTMAACGDDDDTVAAPATADTTAEDGSAADVEAVSDADGNFVLGMIPHHSQAVEMATLALERSEDPTIIDLATRIQGAQDPEIALMRGWLAEWGVDEGAMEGMEGMDPEGNMAGMMTADEMAALAAATGAEFDQMFLEMMIRHHEGAIAMAETVLVEGADPDVPTLATAIITAQRGEIDEMTALQAA